MRPGPKTCLAVLAAALLMAGGAPERASAQITSASVAGTIKDAQGLAIPGAVVTLTSTTRGTTVETVSGDEGYFVFPIVSADTYALKVTMEGFKSLEVPNLQVNAGDKRSLGVLTIEVGALEESVTVSAHSIELQAKSAERSFTIEGEAVQSIAVNGRNFFALAFNAAGIVNTAAQPGALGAQSNTMVANGMRANQNNVQIDGITSMDTGSNQGPSVSLAIDAVQEIKVLTSNYQAEYGRSAGAQITAVTKSGGRDFRGSVFYLRRNDDMNANTWFNNRAIPARPVPPLEQSDLGYSIGGPVILPGGFNKSRSKLFFFFYQEFQDRILAQTTPVRVRLPTELERRGDFSQTRDNAGNLFPYIRDYTTGLPCSASDTRGCFQDGGVLGRIPANRLYEVGLNILKMYPAANSPGTIAQGFNHVTQEGQDAPNRNDLIRLDWAPNSAWRIYGKLLQSFGTRVAPYGGGTTGFQTNIPEFGSRDDQRDNRGISVTAAVTLNNSTFLEMTYGRARNAFTNIPRSDDFTKANLGLSGLPMLYPGAVQLDLPPRFNYNGRVGTSGATGTSPLNSTEYAPFLNENPTQDVAGSLTKTFGGHTMKAGAYFTHGFKPQSHRAPANGNISFQNDASNPLDSGYPFANAALGIYQTYSQAGQWFQGEWVYNNFEWYVQDNWRANDRLTLDYGLRFYWMQPTHDQNDMASNFLPDQFEAGKAPRLYYPATVNGVRVALDRATGQTLPAAAIGRIVPGSGTLQNGLFQQGQGISDQLYENAGIQYAPRFGVSYDLTGRQRMIFRGGAGVFYNRPMGDTVYGMIEQPPSVVSPTLFYGRLQDINPNNALVAPPTLFAFEYEGTFPKVYAFNAGVQVLLPWALVFDGSYVGTRSRDQHTQKNINAPDYGVAYLPQNQDPTLPASSVPGATALPVDFLRPYQGYGNIFLVDTSAYADYNALQLSVNRRFQSGVLFSFNYTLSKAMGTSSVDLPAGNNNPNPNVIGFPRNDEYQDEANYHPLDYDRRHNIVSQFVWQLPKVEKGGVLGAILNDWQTSGVYRWVSGVPYTPTYSIPGISPYTLTGTQGNESARLVITGDPGSGHSSDPYKQFNVNAFTTPKPGSIGLESGKNYLVGPPQNNVDLSISKFIQFGGNRRLELRLDAFNALNHTQFLTVNSTLTVRSLTDPTPTNLAYDANGNLVNPNGFGTVSATRPPREIQLLARFQF
jgi:hypothetical protein